MIVITMLVGYWPVSKIDGSLSLDFQHTTFEGAGVENSAPRFELASGEVGTRPGRTRTGKSCGVELGVST